jgi:hypothetical protein
MWDKGQAQRHLLTLAGDARLDRLYLACPRCGEHRYPLDQRLGVRGYVTPQARKLLSLAGASWSFQAAADHLLEFCGLRTCNQTVRAVCFEEAGLLADWLHQSPEVGQEFRDAAGDVEFYTDGTMVNTYEGWREMRLGIFAKRERGNPASFANWDSRRLPKPHARVLFGSIETAEEFGPRWRAWAARLGIRDPTELTVLADGAEWIWRRVEVFLPGAFGVLDIYHALEHVGTCAKAVFGEGGVEGQRWRARMRVTLLRDGGEAALALIEQTREETAGPEGRRALGELASYLEKQRGHLGYAGRPQAGQAIGSGLVEGACKQVIGRRMKQTGARWRIRRGNRVATLSCAFHGDTWMPYWHHRLH